MGQIFTGQIFYQYGPDIYRSNLLSIWVRYLQVISSIKLGQNPARYLQVILCINMGCKIYRSCTIVMLHTKSYHYSLGAIGRLTWGRLRRFDRRRLTEHEPRRGEPTAPRGRRHRGKHAALLGPPREAHRSPPRPGQQVMGGPWGHGLPRGVAMHGGIPATPQPRP